MLAFDPMNLCWKQMIHQSRWNRSGLSAYVYYNFQNHNQHWDTMVISVPLSLYRAIVPANGPGVGVAPAVVVAAAHLRKQNSLVYKRHSSYYANRMMRHRNDLHPDESTIYSI